MRAPYAKSSRPITVSLLPLVAGLWLASGAAKAAPADGPPPVSTVPPAPDMPSVGIPQGPLLEGSPKPSAQVVEQEAEAPPEAAADRPGVVAELPASAYPHPPDSGIWGGSLWLTFHGLQWPYVPKTGIGFSGSAWLDTGYEQIKRGGVQPDTTYWLQQGRAVLRVTPTYTDGRFFIQGQAELVANKDQTVTQPSVADTDDLWVRFGVWKKWDIQVGRYEAWEIYHLGMGLDLNTLERLGATDSGGATSPAGIYLVGGGVRPSGFGNVAAHLYPTSYLRFEVLGEVGFQSSFDTLGVRPSGILDLGRIKVKVGGEYQKGHGTDTTRDVNGNKIGNQQTTYNRGAGGSVLFVLNNFVEGGVNGSRGLVDATNNSGQPDAAGSFTLTSIGGFANVRVPSDIIVGLGVDWTTEDDLTRNPTSGASGHYAQLQEFVAVQYVLAKQLFIKGVLAYARTDWAPANGAPYSDYMYSGRVRLMYLF
jgi:hypothetical protein